MNGVRRFLNGNGPAAQDSSSVPPQSPPRLGVAIPSQGPSWPPTSPADPIAIVSPQSPPLESAKKTTAGLFLRKDKQKPPPVPSTDEGSVPPSQLPPNGRIAVTGIKADTSSPTLRRKVALPNFNGRTMRDDLLITLLSSEAVVDSREYEVLPAEEVESLKREQESLKPKLLALTKRLTLETKIRDAAISLAKANSSYRATSGKTNEQLEAAERKVGAVQKELWQVTERANEVERRLLQHRAAVLSLSMRSLEEKVNPNQGNGRPDSSLSRSSTPASSLGTAALSPATALFDGPHLFAGHASAISPATMKPPPSAMDIATLEEKLKAATDALGAASKKQAEMARELTMLRLEKEQEQTMMSFELQSAEDQVAALTAEVDTLKAGNTEADLAAQEALRAELETKLAAKDADIQSLQIRLQDVAVQNASSSEAAAQLELIRQQHANELQAKEAEKAELLQGLEMEKLSGSLARSNLEDEHASRIQSLQAELEDLRNQHQSAQSAAMSQMDEANSSLRDLHQTHGIMATIGEVTTGALVASIGSHIGSLNARVQSHAAESEQWEASRRKLQEDIELGLDKRQELIRELEEARREREDARRELRVLEQRMKDRPLSPSSTLRGEDPEYSEDVSKVVAALEPIWAILPSPEARAGKTSRAVNRTDSVSSASSVGSPIASAKSANSLSEMDVRSLKQLYDPNGGALRSPVPSGPFSIQGFVQRVQALITDDRALIERLIRFAQAHDLLKKNAERAQKLAQESNAALETYSKQVKMLEDKNMTMTEKLATVDDRIRALEQTVETLTNEKQQLEASAGEQAETCRQLQEANDTLSARALTLAEEAASATDSTRRQMDTQLEAVKKALEEAQEEIANLSTRNFQMMERQAELEEQLQKRR